MILDGKKLKEKILDEVKEKISKENLKLKLAIITVGDDEASKVYVNNKIKSCEKVGILVEHYKLAKDTLEMQVVDLICMLNDDDSITGIILQSPVPNGIDFDKCSSLIKCEKDVDGFTKENIYNLYLNKDTIIPCTVRGILRLLEEYKINLDGANCLVIGRGNIVGKPLALALLNKNATVTIAHSHTKNIEDYIKLADIIIAAVGIPKLVKGKFLKKDAVVIDVGVSKVNGKIVGDVDFDNLKDKASYITPNPGGVGPMTVAMLILNLLDMHYKQSKIY